jgi:hypothetical protein
MDQENIPPFLEDYVTARNAVSFSLINRLTAHYQKPTAIPNNEMKGPPTFTTFDLMVFRLSRSYDFSVARDHESSAHPGSDVLGELYVRTPSAFSLSAAASYNTYDRIVSSHYEGVGLAVSVLTLNLSHSFSYGGAEYMIGGAGLKLGNWNLGTKAARDIQNSRTTQEEYLLHYASQCWGASLTYTATPGEYRTSVMMDLKGLGSRGTKN